MVELSGKTNEPDFLAGLKKTVDRKLKFLYEVRNTNENMTHSIEKREGMIHAYEDIKKILSIIKQYDTDKTKRG